MLVFAVFVPVFADVQIQLYSGTGTAAPNPNDINAEPFTPSSPFTVTQLGYNFQASPTPGSAFVLGLYSDSSNYPGSLLGQTSEISPSVAGWAFVNLQSSVNVASNTQYWLVIEENGVGFGGLGYAGSGTGLMRYRSFAYSSSMPGTFPAGASGTTGVFWNLGYSYTTASFNANHASFTASVTASNTIQSSLGYSNSLGENVIVVFSVYDSSNNLADSPQGTATNGVTGGTVSATSSTLNPGTYHVSWTAYRASDTSHSNPIDSSTSGEQKTGLTITGPPPNNFTITAACPSPLPTGVVSCQRDVNGVITETVSAGNTATYSLNIQYGIGLTATVNLGSPSGCPVGTPTCTVSPTSVTGTQTVTLSVPTQVTTTGSFSITVTASVASPPPPSHPVTVQLTVNGPSSFPVTVRAGATQIIVTVSYTGSGTTPVYLQDPVGTVTPETSPSVVVYDRISNPTVLQSPTMIHRVTFTLTPSPSSTQTWKVLVSLTLPGSYTVTIEVS
jgi:hypothetical protein